MRKRMMEKLRKISTMYYVRQIVACLLVCYMLFGIPVQVAQADVPPTTTITLPSGPSIPPSGGSVGGYVYDITNPLKPRLDIQGVANRTVINWENFDIGEDALTQFHQLGNNPAVLNRVLGPGQTGIFGSLLANGTVFVINTRGIVFGPDSFIQAQNFVASGIDIQNQNFIDGIYQFETFDKTEINPHSEEIGNVTNEGIGLNHGISAVNVALIGQNVTNKGVIRTAPGGAVIMAAGERVLLKEAYSNIVVEVDMTGPAIPTVDNTGTIEASSGNVGKVVLAAGDIFSVAISGVDSLAATAYGDITLNTGNGDFEAGEMTLTADFDGSGEGNVDINTGVTLDGGDFTSGGVDFDNTGGAITTSASDIVINHTGELNIDSLEAGEAGGEGNVILTTTDGNVLVNDVKALDDQITINSGGAILEYVDDAGVDLTATTLSLTAKTGITGQSPIETSATNITASTDDGNIDIDNTKGSPTTASLAVTTGAGTILFSQAGDGTLDVTSATTADGSIGIDVDNATLTAQTVTAGGDDVDDNVSLTTTASGDVIVDNITAADNTITINSAGAIKGFSVPTIFDPHLTADTLDLTANDGIGWPASNYIQTAANTITASTIDPANNEAHIRLINDNSSPTSLTASTVGTDSWVRFAQRGGGELTLKDVSTVNGGIVIEAKEGDIVATLVNAGGQFGDVYLYTYDSSGDIAVGSVTAAGSGVGVEISSAGSINDAADDKTVDITARHLNLFARDEIGGSPTAGKTFDTLGAIETDVDSLDAHSTGLGGEGGGGGDIVIVEKDDVELHDVIAESGSIFLEATNGGMTHPVGTIKAGGSTMTLVQQDNLDLAGFYFENQENTDLMVKVTNGGFIADDLVPENAADQWQSIQAIATDNIVLQGSDAEEDIKIGTHEGFNPDPLLDLVFGGVVDSRYGGVSIISENGAVRTAGNDILDDVEIWGVSDDELGIGVDLPYGPGKAAIVIMSEETLTLGENAKLTASGWYDTTGDVDDRAGVGFLDVPASIPSGFPRYKGDPFDAAIYLASTGGDVHVSGPVSIESYNMILNGRPNGDDYNGGYYEYIPQGTMVIDAYDSVTFGDIGSPFEVSLENGEVGDRLEVASRITEWLFQAAGRLPYPSYPYYGGGPFPSDYTYTYVLRGAGLDNPAITDGRAWVLVDPTNAPLDREAGENAEKQALGLDGCPVLLAAASAELGIPGETIEVSLANAYALNTDIQPCESCARLVNAAAILRDEDGSRMAAANQVFNALAPADAPFTPEVAASIVTAFAGRINDGTQYATAIEYIDAFVRYIAVLSTEMGSPVGDSLAFVMDKYGAGVLGSDNSNIAAFVATRLESGETFGD